MRNFKVGDILTDHKNGDCWKITAIDQLLRTCDTICIKPPNKGPMYYTIGQVGNTALDHPMWISPKINNFTTLYEKLKY